MAEYLETLRADIPIGRNNAIRRSDLARRWKCDEREVRRIVAAMRAEDTTDPYVVLSSASHPAGYWRSSDLWELHAFVNEMSARAKHTYSALKHAKKVLVSLEGDK